MDIMGEWLSPFMVFLVDYSGVILTVLYTKWTRLKSINRESLLSCWRQQAMQSFILSLGRLQMDRNDMQRCSEQYVGWE